MRPTAEVECVGCGCRFQKELREIRQSEKRGYTHNCSHKCAALYAARQKYGDNFGFGFYRSLAHNRARKKGFAFDLTSAYLQQLFSDQNGRCAVTGIEMLLNSGKYRMRDKNPRYASLDRIDNDGGYVKGNVQFVCLGVNYMRNTFTVEQIKGFLADLQRVR